MEVKSTRRPKREVEGKASAVKAALDKLSRVRKGIAEDKYNMKEEEPLFLEGEEAVESDDDFLEDDMQPTIKAFFPKEKKRGYDSESDEYYDDDEEEIQEKTKSKKIKPPKPTAIQVKIESQESHSEEKQEDDDDGYEVLASASKRLKFMFGSKNNTPQSADRRRSRLLKPLEALSSSSQKRKLDLIDSSEQTPNSLKVMDRKKVKVDFDSVQQESNQIILFDEEPEDSYLKSFDDGPDTSFDFGGAGESWTFGLKGISDEETVTQKFDKNVNFFTDKDGVSHLKMYWLDAFEDLTVHAGRVYIFGKIKLKSDPSSSSCDYISCCLIVENISRKVYLLPKMRGENRIPVSEVHKEFQEKIAPKYNIKLYKTRKVTKFYSFDQPDIPYQSDYLEVVYGSNYAQFPVDLKGQTFTRVFNTTQTPLERLILEVNLKGPSWLRIKNLQPVHNQVSWCKKEFTVDYSPKNITVDAEDVSIPPLLITSINIKTHLSQIISVSCFVKKDYKIDGGIPTSPLDLDLSFCLVTAPTGQHLPVEFKQRAKSFVKGHGNFVKGYDNEQFMLNQFLVNIGKLDPDVIIGHDSSFDLNTIISRQAHFNDKINWSRLSRLRRTKIILGKSNRDRMALTAGRLVCDIQVMGKEFIRAKSYELDELITTCLKKERITGPATVTESYLNWKNLFSSINAFLADNRFILSIMYDLNALPLAMEITKLAGNLFSRTLMGGRSERNEYLLLHAFYEKNFILPDKITKKYFDPKSDEVSIVGETNSETTTANATSKRKAAYSGGLVLDPKVGFYDTPILLMDFNSLYPSIIQEYNICFTTVSKRRVAPDENGDEIPEVPDPSSPCGILPTEIKKLVAGRREVKRLMLQEASTVIQDQLNIKQLALKLTANSMYGCLGFANSRFYAKPLAALVTFKGREILMHTKNLVEGLGMEVIYGDTDSIMINVVNCTDYDDVMKTGRKIQTEVNKIYRQLEIGIDGIYQPMLLLKKKKYAAISLTRDKNGVKKTLEMKGLDIVRRDWSLIAKASGEKILKEILSGKSNQDVVDSIHEKLKKFSDYIRGDISTPEKLKDFEITKSLTKNPEDYADKKGLIHVNVAIRRNANPKVERKLKAGDVVPYIICVDESNQEFNALPSTQRAFHPDELRENASLKIDANYYITQQILPVIARLCEPIEGTDSHIMAEIMGVESSSFHRTSQEELENEVPLSGDLKFDSCSAYKVTCPNETCAKPFEFRDAFRSDGKTKKRVNLSLAQCPHCECDIVKYENRIINQFIGDLRQICDDYYKNWIECVHCNFKTRCCWGYIRDQRKTRVLECAKCGEDMVQKWTDRKLHIQLLFFETLLDRDLALNSLTSSTERHELEAKSDSCAGMYNALRQYVKQLRCTMSYTDVDLGRVFRSQNFTSIKTQNKLDPRI